VSVESQCVVHVTLGMGTKMCFNALCTLFAMNLAQKLLMRIKKEKVPAVIMSEKTPAALSSARGWRSNWQGNKRH
jgi:hypothetical protein